MRVQDNETVSFTVFDADKLDPITVFLQDLAPGCGRLIVECWCTAWAAYWGAMGDSTVREFVLDAHADYIATRMLPQDRKHLKRDEAYLLRIIKVVQQALGDGAGKVGVGKAAAPRPFTGALNDIPATLTHDEGAYAQCGECGRYTLNPRALTDRPPPCDCGSKHGWCGSFKKPGADAKWSGLIQPAAPGVLASDAWRPIETAPRDGTRFEARCMFGTVEIVREVRYADPEDRLPIGDNREVWPDVPRHWRPIAGVAPIDGGQP